MLRALLPGAAVVFFISCNQVGSRTSSIQSQSAPDRSEVAISAEQVNVEAIKSGSAIEGYRLAVDPVMLGSNPCQTGDAKAEINLKKSRKEIVASVIITKSRPDFNVRCTREVRPVYSEKLSIEIRTKKKAYLANFEGLGKKKDLAELIKPSSRMELECSARSPIPASSEDRFKFRAEAGMTETKFYTGSSQSSPVNWKLHDPAAKLSIESTEGSTNIGLKASEVPDFKEQCWQPVTQYRLSLADSSAGEFEGEITATRKIEVDPRALCQVPRIVPVPPVSVKVSCKRN